MADFSRLKIFGAIAALLAVSLACNAPQASPTPDVGLLVAQTRTALAIETWLTTTVAAPPAHETPSTVGTQSPFPTAASASPAASHTPSGPTPTAACSDKAKFVSETIPDGSSLTPGQSFTKSWTFQNVGTCTWSPDYTLVLKSGEAFGSPSPQPLGASVSPNANIEVQVNFTAPAQPGIYESYWMLRNLAVRHSDWAMTRRPPSGQRLWSSRAAHPAPP